MLRRGSFTEGEEFFLRRLLLDENVLTLSAAPNDESGNPVATAKKAFDDEILLSVPPSIGLVENDLPLIPGGGSGCCDGGVKKLPSGHKGAKRRSIKGLWEAHACGVHPKLLILRATKLNNNNSNRSRSFSEFDRRSGTKRAASLNPALKSFSEFEQSASSFDEVDYFQYDENDDDDNPDPGDDTTHTDAEIRPEKNPDATSATSSWDDHDDNGIFDTWEVLRDEYAADFGFDYSTERITIDNILDDDDVGNTFKILGTSADDVRSHPHVLSPPLMDALTNYLPDEIKGQNFWMRFSLVRDGASLLTLKEYIRAARFTILAVETPEGEVFGSFTSTAWRTDSSFYGGPPAFVWKMSQGRRTKCASLYDQARMESQIDAFHTTDKDQLVQACRHDLLSVGGDDGPVVDTASPPSDCMDVSGFAIAIEDDLMVGTTSPSRTFNSPALCGTGDKTSTFNVAGLEVWSFTPCMDVRSAQGLEMSTYTSQRISTKSLNSLSSRDLVPEKFYQRVGDDSESEQRRQRWQYANMMNPNSHDRVFGATPRFSP